MNVEIQSESEQIHVYHKRISTVFKGILKDFLKESYISITPLAKMNVENPRTLPIEEMWFGAKIRNINQ